MENWAVTQFSIFISEQFNSRFATPIFSIPFKRNFSDVFYSRQSERYALRPAWVDYAIILLKFGFVVSVGWLVKRKVKSSNDFLMNGRSIPLLTELHH